MKTKPQTWDTLSRSSKIAACMWPSLVDETIKAQARTIHYDVGKGDPLAARATGNVRSSVRNYDRVPGLKRKK
jgi:hypothetical protein